MNEAENRVHHSSKPLINAPVIAGISMCTLNGRLRRSTFLLAEKLVRSSMNEI